VEHSRKVLETTFQTAPHAVAMARELLKGGNLAERVGFEKALSDRLFAFNKMPKTDVFTVTYLLSHLEHESQKKR